MSSSDPNRLTRRRSVRTIDVTCPTCWAGPGWRCTESTDLTSPLLDTPHPARVAAAVAADDRKTQP